MPTKQRIPAAQRRDALIDAAVEEFAHGGFHATPVDRIARRVGVAQPYVFSLFPRKKDLFLAAVRRAFDQVTDRFSVTEELTLAGLGDSFIELLGEDRRVLTLQLHAYAAACEDEEIAAEVRAAFDGLIAHVQTLTGASDDEMSLFAAQGMWLNVQAAMRMPNLERSCDWIKRVEMVSE